MNVLANNPRSGERVTAIVRYYSFASSELLYLRNLSM